MRNRNWMWLVVALILAMGVASVYAASNPIELRRGRAGVGWMVVASDDDVDGTAAVMTELDTTYVQMATASTIYAVSTDSNDITQTLYVSGITTAGKKVTTTWLLTGDTQVAESSVTYSYVDQTWLDKECAGTVSVKYGAGGTLINSIEIGSLKGDIGQHFNGEDYSYIQSWQATSNSLGDKTLQLRWYPDDADCLDSGDGFVLLDRIMLAGSVYRSEPHSFADYADGGIKLPRGGWLAVFGSAAVANQEATVTVIGFDRRR